MGDTALDTDEELEIEGEEAEELDPKDGEETQEGEDSEDKAEEPEFEIVRESVEGSQPVAKRQNGFQKRISKLNDRNAAKDEVISGKDEALRIAEEKNRLYELALEQKNEAETLKAPNPDDFEDDYDNAKFNKAQSDYTQKFIADEVKKATANIPAAQTEAAPDNQLIQMQTKHYEEAEKLGAKNYEEVEDNAISILGNDVSNFIIGCSDNSPAIMYFLGTKKNQAEAEEIAELVKTNPGRAAMRLGRLEAEIKIPSRAIKQPAPDPDDELQGGSTSYSNKGPEGATFE